MKRPQIKPLPDLWLIWSIEHDAWWRPSHRGYTPLRKEAGLYEYEEALQIVKGANITMANVPNEAMIKATRDEVENYPKRLQAFATFDAPVLV